MIRTFQTPMMRQYMQIKKDYQDCLLFFRLGDFYELFMEDAEIGSKILDITLTARHKGKDGKVPMCGVPFHAIDTYIGKLVKAGHKVALCEQTSKPTPGVDIVEREVVRVVTPGTLTDENVLDSKSDNFLLTFSASPTIINLAYADISTGKFFIKIINNDDNNDVYKRLEAELNKINPSEVLLNQEQYSDPSFLQRLKSSRSSDFNIFPHYLAKRISSQDGEKFLEKFFKVKSLSIFDIDHKNRDLIKTIVFLLDYLQYTQKDNLFHIKKITNASEKTYMQIDVESLRNLEIFTSTRTDYCLFSTIDKTKTSLGARELKRWILYPLMDKKEINLRQNCIQAFIKNSSKMNKLKSELESILDIERILSHLGTKNANGRDLLALKESLIHSKKSIDLISEEKVFKEFLPSKTVLKNTDEVVNLIKSSLQDEPPVSIREGGLIKEGVSQKLDDIKNSISDSKTWLAELEAKEKKRTGISTLKVGFNSVFGYYIEVTRANSKLVPQNYVRKQTLVNAERYITEELKYKEEIILNAEEKIAQIEYELFMKLLDDLLKYALDIQEMATSISQIDCFYSLARLAVENKYVKPEIFDSKKYSIELDEARHPVVETSLAPGEFTPNSTKLSHDSFIHLITGPNMAGKSTYIRQVALIQILAQIGSFVPAQKAKISIVDGIYTRIGAGDALAQGLSTFMVEMIEVAKILHTAGKNSLIILDEVGRGTSTIDGLSIARAVTEYIHDKLRAKTLFATHFHELTTLEQRLKALTNYHILVSDETPEIRFLHKVEKGGTDKSYGVEVAKLAGVPDEVINRAREILQKNTTDQLKLDL